MRIILFRHHDDLAWAKVGLPPLSIIIGIIFSHHSINSERLGAYYKILRLSEYVEAERDPNLMYTVREINKYTLKSGSIKSDRHLDSKSSRDSFQLVIKKTLTYAVFTLYSLFHIKCKKKNNLFDPNFFLFNSSPFFPHSLQFIKIFTDSVLFTSPRLSRLPM